MVAVGGLGRIDPFFCQRTWDLDQQSLFAGSRTDQSNLLVLSNPPECVRFHVAAQLERIPIVLDDRGLDISSFLFPGCELEIETLDHRFVKYPFSLNSYMCVWIQMLFQPRGGLFGRQLYGLHCP